ncbi:MAG: MgtC/SapB family protein [Phycisphaerales bacterium]|nr:MgtC/SapB family protein [Phycisphaerales bacterium]
MNFLVDNLYHHLSSPLIEILLAVCAVLAGAVVGAERERRDKPAGLRTLILVCLGSAVFSMVSFAFAPPGGDGGRVAAQIVTGVGFLGAGAILQMGSGVIGMTTAAIVWVTAAIGMTIGAGFPGAGLGLSVLVWLVMVIAGAYEARMAADVVAMTVRFCFEPDHGRTAVRLLVLREKYRVNHMEELETRNGDGLVSASIKLRLPRRQMHQFLMELIVIPAIRDIHAKPD